MWTLCFHIAPPLNNVPWLDIFGLEGSNTVFHWRILAQCGNVHCIGQSNVYEWVETFKSGRTGRTSVSDQARSVRPSSSCIQDDIKRANALIHEERRIILSEVAEIPDIRSWNLQFAALEEDCCRKPFSCTMTMLATKCRSSFAVFVIFVRFYE